MFAIMGVTGKVGGATARALLADGQAIRVIVRDAHKGDAWARLGAEVAIADLSDVTALTAAFAGVDGVFAMLPPAFDPQPGFTGAKAMIAVLRQALAQAAPGKAVVLSTVGAEAVEENLLSQLRLLEAALGDLPLPVTFLRPAWFIDNAVWDLPGAKGGVISSFLQPAERAIPMVAAEDVGREVATLLEEDWTAHRIVELEGPQRVSPADIAAAFGQALGREVRVQTISRAEWEPLFRAQGMSNPLPRMSMLDGFNEGWIDFADSMLTRKGRTTLDAVIGGIVEAG